MTSTANYPPTKRNFLVQSEIPNYPLRKRNFLVQPENPELKDVKLPNCVMVVSHFGHD